MSFLSLMFDLLFVGQALIGADLPRQVETALRAAGVTAQVQVHAVPGAATLEDQWSGADRSPVNARGVLASGAAPVLVLAERPDAADPAAAAQRFHALATAADPAAQVWLMADWPAFAGDVAAWRAALDRSIAATEGVADTVNAVRAPGTAPLRIVPAAGAMALVADRAAAGQVPGLRDAAGLFAPSGQLNDRGEYLVAITAHAAVAARSPEGLPPRLRRLWTTRDGVVTAPMAAAMQAAVRTAVEAAAARPVAEPLSAEASPRPPALPPAPVAAVPADPPDAVVLAPTAEPEIRNPNIGIGLAGVVDWTAAQPFVDVFRTARPWTGHLPGQYGGWGHDELSAGGWLDENGWPRAIPPALTHLSALILTDLPADAASTAGRYRVTWTGTGRLGVGGLGRPVSSAPNEIWFEFRPGNGTVFIDLLETDPADPVRDIRVVQERNIAAFEGGAVFEPLWLSRLRGVRLLRFMDWSMVNNARLSRAEDRPRPADYTWARHGVPIEVQVALANELGADAWFNMPHRAEDALLREAAEIVRDGLDPRLRAYVELSNEVWNWQFEQARWAEERGRERWRGDSKWVEYYALRASEMARIWADAFGPDGAGRLVRVIATQTGWTGLEDQMLNAPSWRAEVGAGFVEPWRHFDAYAVTGYFSANLGSDEKVPVVRRWIAESEAAAVADARAQGLTGPAAAEAVARHRYDRAVALAARELADGSVTGDAGDTLDRLLSEVLPYHAEVARKYGLQLVMYEGGSHLVGYGRHVDDDELTGFLTHLSFTPEMGALYRRLIDGWAALSPAPFMQFGDVFKPVKFGSWGALRHPADDNPRWRALIAAR